MPGRQATAALRRPAAGSWPEVRPAASLAPRESEGPSTAPTKSRASWRRPCPSTRHRFPRRSRSPRDRERTYSSPLLCRSWKPPARVMSTVFSGGRGKRGTWREECDGVCAPRRWLLRARPPASSPESTAP
eukprot:7389009-Prymnesium_polylepis.1